MRKLFTSMKSERRDARVSRWYGILFPSPTLSFLYTRVSSLRRWIATVVANAWWNLNLNCVPEVEGFGFFFFWKLHNAHRFSRTTSRCGRKGEGGEEERERGELRGQAARETSIEKNPLPRLVLLGVFWQDLIVVARLSPIDPIMALLVLY